MYEITIDTLSFLGYTDYTERYVKKRYALAVCGKGRDSKRPFSLEKIFWYVVE